MLFEPVSSAGHRLPTTLLLIAVAGMLLTAACTANKATADAPAGVPVTVATVGVLTVPVVREFVGQTSAKETVELRARVSGFLEKVNFQEGSHVRTGEVLFQIEQSTYQSAVASAEAQLAKDQANLTKASRDVARLRPLAAAKAAPEQDLDTAVALSLIHIYSAHWARAFLPAPSTRIPSSIRVTSATSCRASRRRIAMPTRRWSN